MRVGDKVWIAYTYTRGVRPSVLHVEISELDEATNRVTVQVPGAWGAGTFPCLAPTSCVFATQDEAEAIADAEPLDVDGD